MAAFAVLSDAGALGEISDALEQSPERLIGVWIDGGSSRGRGGRPPAHDGGAMVSRLASVPALGVEPVRQVERWSICRIATLSQVTLLDLLMYLSGGRQSATSGHFVPIFRADIQASHRRAAWFELAERYPGGVLPPLVQDARGRLSYDDVGWQASPSALQG